MFLNEYVNHERHKDLLREADQRRMASEVMQPTPLTQQLGTHLLKLGVALVKPQDECYRVETSAQVVTICLA
jgi:hypothetical protein